MDISFELVCDELRIEENHIRVLLKKVMLSKCRIFSEKHTRISSGMLYICDASHIEKIGILPEKSAILFTNIEQLPDTQRPCAIAKNYDCKTELLNRVLDIFDKYNSWDASLLEILSRDGDMQDYVDASVSIFNNPLWIADPGFKVLAMDVKTGMPKMCVVWKYMNEHGYLRTSLVMGLEHDVLYKHCHAFFFKPKQYICMHLFHNIRIDGVMQCIITLVEMYRKFKNTDLELVEHFGKYIAKKIKKDRTIAVAFGSIHESLLTDIISEKITSHDEIADRSRVLNWNSECSYAVVIIPLTKDDPLKFALNFHITSILNAKTSYHKGKFVAVFPIGSKLTLEKAESRLSSLLKELSLTAGISDEFNGLYRLPQYYLQASDALDLGNSEAGNLFRHSDCFMKRIVKLLSQTVELSTLEHSAITLLDEYDKQYDSELLYTLEMYIKNESSASKTSKLTFLHRNTLAKRLERINELTSLDLEDYESRMRLLLSFHIHEYLKNNS